MKIFADLFSNNVLITALIAWFTAQVLKVILTLITSKKLDFGRIIGSGGMPSSHSAFVVSLSVVIGLTQGFESPEFALSACFALVVMYDAAGVRRSAGEQAKILNKMVEAWEQGDFTDTDKKLKELLGHTPVEVFAGAVLGLVIAVIRGI